MSNIFCFYKKNGLVSSEKRISEVVRESLAAAFLVLFLSAPCAFAQNSDSLAFLSGNWNTEQVAEGMAFSQCSFEGSLFGSNQTVSVLTVAPGHRFGIVEVPDSTLMRTTDIAADAGALAAINGSFFNMKMPFGAVTYTRVDGETVGENSSDTKNGRWRRGSLRSGAVAVFEDGAYILKSDGTRNWEKYIQGEDVLTSGPILIIDGQYVPQEESSFNRTRHPRTAIGKRSDGTIVMVITDGRHKEAAGMSMRELQQIMSWLGCSSALNLDGGGSSTMVIKGKIVNYPCDNRLFDHEGERKVANAVLVF